MIYKSITFSLIIVLLVAIPPAPAEQTAEDSPREENVRKPLLAGSWYPANPKILARSIRAYLSNAAKEIPKGRIKGVIVPHAGHMYSGQVAAYAYRLLEKTDFKRIVMIGPSHRALFEGISVNLRNGYETPLGIAPVDRDFAQRLIESSPRISWVPRAHAREHSLEIQLPFIQTVLNHATIVPILMGQQDYGTCQELANSLANILKADEKTLLLASTDLSHFHSYERAKAIDREFIKHVQNYDPEGLGKSLSLRNCEACGGGPAVATLLAAQKLGAKRSVILNYANSGDVTGDHRRVVGYLSAVLIKEE